MTVMLATSMEVLDTSAANVALPHIAGSLSATAEEATRCRNNGSTPPAQWPSLYAESHADVEVGQLPCTWHASCSILVREGHNRNA